MVRVWSGIWWRIGLSCCLALVMAGCAREQKLPALRPALSGVAPVLAVEKFLTAVNTNDLDTMARLFGTRDGSILRRDPRAEVETRMYALATILRHKNYAVEGEGIVPGRLGEAVELTIRLSIEEREISVPFIVVQTRRDGWLIEQIGIERITAGG
jgi:hypothetical protein